MSEKLTTAVQYFLGAVPIGNLIYMATGPHVKTRFGMQVNTHKSLQYQLINQYLIMSGQWGRGGG